MLRPLAAEPGSKLGREVKREAWLPEVNRKKLLQTGCCVWLKVSPEEIWRRVGKHLQQRPLLSKSKNPRQAIKTLVEERNPYYSLAHACIETTGKPPQQVALEIVKVFKKYRPFDLPKLQNRKAKIESRNNGQIR